MEYCDRGDLSKKLICRKNKRDYFTNEQIWDFTKQIMWGMLALHSNGIVHRDIKNKNIYWWSNGDYKIGDLSEWRHLAMNKVTKATFWFGTPQTTPPEIVNKGLYDHRVDLWSLGVVLYQLSNLELPFQEENVTKLYKAIWNKEPRPMKNEFLSTSLKSLISKLLTKDRKVRISLVEIFNRYLQTQCLHIDDKANLQKLAQSIPSPHVGALTTSSSNHALWTLGPSSPTQKLLRPEYHKTASKRLRRLWEDSSKKPESKRETPLSPGDLLQGLESPKSRIVGYMQSGFSLTKRKSRFYKGFLF